jgi:chromosome partitioning protein
LQTSKYVFHQIRQKLPMILSITSLKGGTGKSTLSINLAVCFAHMGYRVAIIDTDTNASAVHWSGLRAEDLPPVTVFGITEANALQKNIAKIGSDYDIILIDGRPSLSKLVSTIILLGDLVLIPVKPSGLDIWATEKFLEQYEQARVLKQGVAAYFVLNEFDEKMNLNKDSKDALGEFEIPTLEATVKSRVAYRESAVMGMGVYEYKDARAKAEMVALTAEVLQLLQHKAVKSAP